MAHEKIILVTDGFQSTESRAPKTELLAWTLTEHDVAVLEKSQAIAGQLRELSERGPEAARLSVGRVFIFADVPEELISDDWSERALRDFLEGDLQNNRCQRAHDGHFVLVRPDGKVTLAFAEKHCGYTECYEDLFVDGISRCLNGEIEDFIPDEWLLLRD